MAGVDAVDKAGLEFQQQLPMPGALVKSQAEKIAAWLSRCIALEGIICERELSVTEQVTSQALGRAKWLASRHL